MPKPTREDANLLLRVFDQYHDRESSRAFWWFFEQFDEKNYAAFRKKYPMGSEGSRNFEIVASYYELVGSLVGHALLNEDLVFDIIGVPWKKAEPIIHGLRKERKEPRLYENFEVLAKKFSAWEKTHPPKV